MNTTMRRSVVGHAGRGGLGRTLLPALVWLASIASARDPAHPLSGSGRPAWRKRWVRIALNLLVDRNAEQAQRIIERAAAAGYNGVVLADFKLHTWWDPHVGVGSKWQKNAVRVRRKAAERGLECVVAVAPIGYAGGILIHDPNLAAGHPVRDASLVARAGSLVPVCGVRISNPSFEDHRGSHVRGWFHDDPGKGSFADTETVRDGRVSLRFECGARANRWGHNRVSQVVRVRPFQQYRVHYWVKLEEVTGQYQTLVLSEDGKRSLQRCGFQTVSRDSPPIRRSLQHVTTGWVEQTVAFNSLDHTTVRLYMGIWNGRSGRMWIDGVRIEAVPTLNLLRRDDLPVRVVGKDGTEYVEGRDFARVVDPRMGRARWPGTYGVAHDPPVIRLLPGSRIREGQTVLFSGYHALTMPDNQINCSLYNEKVFALCRAAVRHNRDLLDPDGWFLAYDEMRTGGWEPEETRHFETTGELLAWNVKRMASIVRREGGGKPMYVWSDMFDPNHNARANYYLVNNTLAGSWEGLPEDMTIVTWIPQKNSLEFFAGRGHRQIVAGYYDQDVRRNYEKWLGVIRGVPGVIGTVYCTWSDRWNDLERYAQVWWGGKE